MKSFTRYMLVIAMVGAMLSSIVGAAGAQEAPTGYLAAVNGASTNPVAVTAGDVVLASDLDYTAASTAQFVPLGGYDVTFTGDVGSIASIEVAEGSAQTVVSGFGDPPDSAKAYPITVAEIPDTMAMVAFSNATISPVDVSINGDGPTTVPPGGSIAPAPFTAGDEVTITIGTAETKFTPGNDSYTDAFAVDDGTGVTIATSVVPSMTDLIAQLAPPAGDVVVPNVVGQAEAAAIDQIVASGLTVGATSSAPDDTVPAGDVTEQAPAAGESVPAGTPVNIIVSTGPDTTPVPVPDVVGLPEGDAQKALEDGGFAVTSTEEASADVEIGLVISTNPTAGTEVAPGTTVEMIVSSGPGEVVVPDLIGMTADEATAAAEAAGLTISVVQDPDNPDPDGVVVKQDPAAGTTVDGGSEVVAQLSPDLGEPWAIVHLDPNRLMTVAGVGMLPDSTVNLSVVGTDLTESVAVQADGSWSAKFDLSDVENETEFLLVEGTAADTSDYSVTFKIPAAGQSTEVPTEETATEDSSFPIWGWLLIGVALIALVLLIIRMVQGNNDDSTPDTDSGNTDAS